MPENATVRAACYVRVSTEEQKKYGISVDAQISALEAYCADHGYIIAGLYNDAGISARKSYTGRPALGRLISDCRDGKIDIILFCKLDRWTRSVGDYYEIERKLNNVPWAAIQEDYETQTPAGRFKVNIMLSVSQNEADITASRIKATFDYKRAKGEPCSGAVPVGYRIRDKHLEFDPQTYEGMTAFFRTYIETLSLDKSIAAAQDRGISMSRSTADARLRNPVYRGEASYGQVPAYITQDEWTIIDANMHSRARRTGNNDRTYIFSGLLFCGKCGCRMAGHTQVPGSKRSDRVKYEIPGYTCHARAGRKDKKQSCRGIYQNERKLEKYLVENLFAFLDEYNRAISIGATDHSAEIRRLEAKLSRTKELYIDGDITRDEYNDRKETILGRVAALKEDQKPKQVIELPDGWQDMYYAFSPEAKQVFWRKIIKRIVVFEGHRIEVEF